MKASQTVPLSRSPRSFRSKRLLVGLLLCLAPASLTFAEQPLNEAFFTQKVFPILQDNCFKCHSHASGKNKGGLLLDSLPAMLEGGETGPALVVGKPAESLLLKLIRSKDTETQMPPKGDRLSEDSIKILESWIQEGAFWPKTAQSSLLPNGPSKRAPGGITEDDRKWWAFVPVQEPEIPAPATSATGNHPIDRFIDARLLAEDLEPAPEAEKRVLIRRVTQAVTGLPPTPAEIEAFLSNNTPEAYDQLVDRLLESPRYGERMARLWMDLVRYADSDGYRVDDYRPTAWRYRDYLIQAFNANKPYDRFVQEQLAGDELFPGDPQALTATGYLRMWIYEYNNRDARGQWETILNDVTDTTADVFMGLGMQCARCHDHKFDPILQKDYFALQSFFAGILPRQDRPAATPVERENYHWKLAKWEEKTFPILKKIAAIEDPHRARAEKEAVTKFPDDIQEMIRKAPEQRTPLETQLAALAWRQVEYEWERLERRIKGEQREELSRLHRELAQFDSIRPAPLPPILSVTDVGSVAPVTKIPKKGTEVGPAFPTVMGNEFPAPPAAIYPPEQGFSTGRRASLAMWLTRPENPLTARVFVNRIWQMHFRQGIASFASDFGKLGEPPSHPELLDWLASQFVKDGWDIKQLHRRILTSAAYRRSSNHPNLEAGLKKDPTNRLLWRAQPIRLEAEQIRDSIFFVSGELKEDRGGAGVPFTDPKRSVYTRIMRNGRDPLTDAFDAPLWFASASSRDVTTTPIQSLLLINSPFMLQRSKAFAERVLHSTPGNRSLPIAQKITSAYQLAYGRPPSPEELRSAEKFIQRQVQIGTGNSAALSHRGFIPEKIPFRDGQGALFEPGGTSGFKAKDSIGINAKDGFTVEAFILPRTVADTAALRTIVGKWNGNYSTPGWRLGITGQKSRRTPMVIALQTVGLKQDGKLAEVPFFSGLRIQMNKPYFVSAAINYADQNGPGSVTFSVKDLSNDDEPLLVDTIPCDIYGIPDNKFPVTLGSQSGTSPDSFHGVLDDVRFSEGVLPTAMQLLQSENANPATKGFWRFESKPDIMADLSGNGHNLEAPEDLRAIPKAEVVNGNADIRNAFAAFCHALFNSSEFLYTE
ncbi:MAG: PSD1 and planctomycete cytochrome C domain-containing protein [Verrucomicrobiota bacterium]